MRDPLFLAKLRAFILGLRPRKIRRRLLERRARRQASRARRALDVPSPSAFFLEPLEGRVLLSADFVGAVDLLNQPILPSEAPAVSALLESHGSRTAPGAALLTTIQSHRGFQDPAPHPGFFGSWFAEWHFGDRHGSPESLTVRDADGTKVTFTLTGPGEQEVVRDGNGWDVSLTGTDARSIFTIKTRGGDGQVELDDVRVDGSLGQLRAGTADLSGDLSIRGTLHRLVLDDVDGGTVSAKSIDEIRIQGDLEDATFLIGADLGDDGRLGGSGADADEFGPGHVRLFRVEGDVDDTTVRVGIDPVDGRFDNGNDRVLGGTTSAIHSVRIGDSLDHGSLFQAGALPKHVKVDHDRIDPAHDHRFLAGTRGHEARLSLEAHLKHDTGASASDAITSDPTISGTLVHSERIKSFKAGFDDLPARDFVSIKGELRADGQFVLDRSDLARISEAACHAPLADGTHTLHLIATDAKGHTIQRDITFTLDTRPPKQPTVDLAPAFDSAPVGDHRTTFDVVTLVGRTSPGALVALVGTEAATTADQNGRFVFDEVALALGANRFTVKATDLAGNKSYGSVCITRVAAARPTVAINDVTVTEGDAGTTSAVFTVSLSAASTQPVTVGFATADGTAGSAGDYVAQTGTLTFAAGATAQSVTVAVVGDAIAEPTEKFFVNLTAPTSATLGDAKGVGTILDNDSAPAPTLTINDVTVTEGNAGTASAVFTASLSAPSTQPVTVGFATADDTAGAGSDYAAASGTLTFAPGTTAQQITVPVTADLLDEPAERFFVRLGGATGATIADGEGIGTITDDDAAPTVTIDDVTVTEGHAGIANAVFTVSLSAASGQVVSVDFATANESAAAPGDYAAQGGTLTFAPGATTRQITVAVAGDMTFEPTESFLVELTAATNATIADPEGTGSITNDDAQPTLAISDAAVQEGNAATTNLVFTVSLSGASSQTITAEFVTADNTAGAPGDYGARLGGVT
ncbi:MAG: Calx-beta domain-containing protein, partial [Candidatus Rokuibacteriota bacterium]